MRKNKYTHDALEAVAVAISATQLAANLVDSAMCIVRDAVDMVYVTLSDHGRKVCKQEEVFQNALLARQNVLDALTHLNECIRLLKSTEDTLRPPGGGTNYYRRIP